MKTEVTFREGRPAADMTRDEVVTWLLGSLRPVSFSGGVAAAWAVSNMVDHLRDEAELLVEVNDGTYILTVTTTRRWLRSTRTYHAEEQ